MPRPPKSDTVQFRRKLDNPKLQILLAAGQGNISQGFENVLALYQYAHSKGYRSNKPLETVEIVTNLAKTTGSPNDEESIRNDIRESIGNR